MKLIMAIINNDDSTAVADKLMAEGFYATRLATTGGYLKAGNTTFIVGIQDDKVDQVLGIIKENSQQRTQIIPAADSSFGGNLFSSTPVEVKVGGATVFVLDIEHFEKC